MRWRSAAIVLALGFSSIQAQQKISLPTTPELSRADVYVLPFEGTARATLVLCPGQNGNGLEMLKKSEWQEFAQQEQLNLAAISFSSPDKYLQANTFTGGYYLASHGSGDALLHALNRALGEDQPPILIYGFSGGAHYTFSFVKAQPSLVKAWCAYSAGWWEEPDPDPVGPPGIIACGENDGFNYGPSLVQFTKGRGMGKPWTWISVPNTGHSWSNPLESFVRSYFAALLDHPQDRPLWLDIDTKNPVAANQIAQIPTVAVWLPNADVAELWKKLHKP